MCLVCVLFRLPCWFQRETKSAPGPPHILPPGLRHPVKIYGLCVLFFVFLVVPGAKVLLVFSIELESFKLWTLSLARSAGAARSLCSELQPVIALDMLFCIGLTKYGCGSKPLVPFWGRSTTHFSLFFAGIGMFTGGTIWILTHTHMVAIESKLLLTP